MLAENEFFELPETLTGFIRNKDVQAEILELINLPLDLIKNEPVKAPPQTKRYVITGTAFEIFIQCRIYRDFKKKCLNEIDLKVFERSAKKDKVWQAAWEKAHEEIQKYLNKEIDATDDFFRALIVAANLMNFYRSGALPLDINKAGQEEIQDLKNLMAVIPWEKFKPKKYVFLSPIFKCHDSNVCAADGDLIIDDVLIDIKTVQKNDNRMLWCQLAGYYQLFHGRGIKATKALVSKVHINSLGVYFARHGILQIVEDRELFKSPAEIEASGMPMKYVSNIFLT